MLICFLIGAAPKADKQKSNDIKNQTTKNEKRKPIFLQKATKGNEADIEAETRQKNLQN
jgi:hypothetical protein